MRITAWILIAIAIALSVLAGQAATADPEARNHGINKRQESPKNRVQQRVQSGEPTAKEVRDPAVNARQEHQKEIREEKHD